MRNVKNACKLAATLLGNGITTSFLPDAALESEGVLGTNSICVSSYCGSRILSGSY